jgi:hypothetical protein
MDIAALIAKEKYDNQHSPIEFEEGNTVYVKLGKGYSLPGKLKCKWSPLRSGPHKIIRKVNLLAYELDFPKHWRVHPVLFIA